jgi:hypothetical protein
MYKSMDLSEDRIKSLHKMYVEEMNIYVEYLSDVYKKAVPIRAIMSNSGIKFEYDASTTELIRELNQKIDEIKKKYENIS